MKKILIIGVFIVIANSEAPTELVIHELHNRPLTLQQSIMELVPDSLSTLVYAMIEVESNWDIYAHSSTGDHGLMQINKHWWSDKFDFERIYEPEYNVLVGLAILTPHLEKGCVKQALRRYNGSIKYAHVVNKKHYALFGEYLF